MSNRLIARAVYGFDAGKVTPAGAKALCQVALRQLRQFFLVDPDTGRRWGPAGSSSIFREWFNHDGFHLNEEPEDRVDSLEQITEVVATAVIFRDAAGARSESVMCKAPLLGKEAYCSP
jgi:hypothetical protein